MKLEVLFVKSKRTLVIASVLPNGRFYMQDGLKILTNNPSNTIKQLIEQLQNHLKLAEDLSTNK